LFKGFFIQVFLKDYFCFFFKSKSDQVSDDLEQNLSFKEKRASEIALSTDMCGLSSKGFNVLHRHINQIVVRGDNVVMVTLVD
jgi:hypothetical protein